MLYWCLFILERREGSDLLAHLYQTPTGCERFPSGYRRRCLQSTDYCAKIAFVLGKQRPYQQKQTRMSSFKVINRLSCTKFELSVCLFAVERLITEQTHRLRTCLQPDGMWPSTWDIINQIIFFSIRKIKYSGMIERMVILLFHKKNFTFLNCDVFW